MKDILQLHETAGYLPYGVKCRFSTDEAYTLIGLVNEAVYLKEATYPADLFLCKPILRPMSDLIGHKIAKEIFNDDSWLTGKSFKETVSDFIHSSNHLDFCFAKYDWDKFYEHHFDIHNLIGRGLAIDINTLKD